MLSLWRPGKGTGRASDFCGRIGGRLKAYCLIREAPWYRREIFASGLKAAGHAVHFRRPDRIDRDTLLVIWNRYNEGHVLACAVEKAGGRVLVAENGYLGALGTSPKFDVHPGGPQPHHYYALAEGWHNGRGTVRVGARDRFERLGIELKPWRTNEGGHVLVCPNRSFGVGEQVMHPDWAERTAARLRKHTQREVRVRTHPGNNRPRREIAEDLAGAHAVVVWSSSVAQHALAEGIHTWIEAPWQIVKHAGSTGALDAPSDPDRLPHFTHLAWAQWTCAEIESGEPFRHILQ